ncbi:hypothetical protein AB0N65_13015 [Paenarthrobacter sp. NPDC089322]|uniref:hypothetical protein n=1 Tax=Paenarthrobacter sp. NPDC089322 TaxID=3155065 RepID=UPI003429EF75
MQRTVPPAVVPSAPGRRVPIILAGALLAAGVWLVPHGSAQAAPCVPETGGTCPALTAPTEPTPTEPVLAPEAGKTKPTPKPQPTIVREAQQPPAPAPAGPAPAVQAPQPAVVAPVTAASQVTPTPSAAPETTTTATATASASATPTPSSTPSPSKSSNWNTPIDRGKETQAAVMASSSWEGPNMLGLFALGGGVLLIGLGGLVFALWSKNRLSEH